MQASTPPHNRKHTLPPLDALVVPLTLRSRRYQYQDTTPSPSSTGTINTKKEKEKKKKTLNRTQMQKSSSFTRELVSRTCRQLSCARRCCCRHFVTIHIMTFVNLIIAGDRYYARERQITGGKRKERHQSEIEIESKMKGRTLKDLRTKKEKEKQNETNPEVKNITNCENRSKKVDRYGRGG